MDSVCAGDPDATCYEPPAPHLTGHTRGKTEDYCATLSFVCLLTAVFLTPALPLYPALAAVCAVGAVPYLVYPGNSQIRQVQCCAVLTSQKQVKPPTGCAANSMGCVSEEACQYASLLTTMPLTLPVPVHDVQGSHWRVQALSPLIG
jgi:hypothetical protein